MISKITYHKTDLFITGQVELNEGVYNLQVFADPEGTIELTDLLEDLHEKEGPTAYDTIMDMAYDALYVDAYTSYVDSD